MLDSNNLLAIRGVYALTWWIPTCFTHIVAHKGHDQS